MSQVNAFFRRTGNGHLHWCPGCEAVHVIPYSWEFNNDYLKPTFNPSVRHSWGSAAEGKCCHYNLTKGEIMFHADSTHWLAGTTVTLQALPVEYTGDKFSDGV